MHTQAHIFDEEISAKTAILAGFRASDHSFSKMMPKHSQWVSRAVRTSFRVQRVGYDGIKSQSKYLHTQAQKFDDEVSGNFSDSQGVKRWFFENDAETCAKSPRSVLWAPGDVEHQYWTFYIPQ